MTREEVNNPIKVIVWDMHGVLFVKNIWHWVYVIITFPRLLSALWHMSFSGYVLCFKYILRKLRLYTTEFTNEELIEVCKRDNNKAMIQLIMLVSCDYVPLEATFEIIKLLQKKGYVQYIASNVGETVFAQFKHQYHDYFTYFSGFFTVKAPIKGLVIKKPNQLYFEYVSNCFKIDPKTAIFIDDNADNVRVARMVGFCGHIFTSPNNLRTVLNTLEIL